MSAVLSAAEREVRQTYLPRREAYKLLIIETAGELREENLKDIFWLANVPQKYRGGCALDVLEHLHNAGYFSERDVQPLSDLLKKAGRADLTSSVDNYTAQHARRSSLPSGSAHPPPPSSPSIPHSCSYSEGTHTHSTPLPTPLQETRLLETSQECVYSKVGSGTATHSLESSQEHFSPALHQGGGAVQVPRPFSAVPAHSGNPHAMQGPHFNWTLPNQSTSLEGLPQHTFQWGGASQPLASGGGPGSLTLPGSNQGQPHRSWVDSRSLSNSGTSQDAFSLYSEPTSLPRSSPRIRTASEPFPLHFRMGTVMQPVYSPGTGPRPVMPQYAQPHLVSNWYQASYPSASSIPQDAAFNAGSVSSFTDSHPPLFDPYPRQGHGQYQYLPHHSSASETSLLSSSQESYVNIPHSHGRHSLPVGYRYHPGRTPSFTRTHSPLKHQSISEYPSEMDPGGEEFLSEGGVASAAGEAAAAALGGDTNKHARSKASNENVPPPNESGAGSVGALNEKQLRVQKGGDLSKSDRPPSDIKNACKMSMPKSIAEEVTININNNQDTEHTATAATTAAAAGGAGGSNDVIYRRPRTNSAKLTNSAKPTNRNRLSLQLAAADEKSRRRYSSASGGGAMGGAMGGSGNLAESRASHISCSRASTLLSTSTLNSEDSHFSPHNSITKSRATVAAVTASATASASTSSPSQKPAPHVQKKKETSLISRLKRVAVARREDQIQWSIKTSKLNKIIYKHQRDKHLVSPKLEVEAGPGSPNPRLVLCLHPYGLEEDTNNSVTLEVRIETSARSKASHAQRLDSRAEVEVSVRAEDKEGMELGRRCVTQSARLSYFLVQGFIDHQLLKQSQSDTVVVTCSANLVYISAV